MAPDFKLNSIVGEIKLSDYFRNTKKASPNDTQDKGGKWVVIFFYSGDFTSVCGTEIPEFQQMISEFSKLNAQVLGISADSVYSQQAWIKKLETRLDYPLLSDFNKIVCREYGILDENSGEPL